MTEGKYVYICPDPECAKHSGEYTTTVPPHVFPRCMWCGRTLEPVTPPKPEAEASWAGYPLTWGDEG